MGGLTSPTAFKEWFATNNLAAVEHFCPEAIQKISFDADGDGVVDSADLNPLSSVWHQHRGKFAPIHFAPNDNHTSDMRRTTNVRRRMFPGLGRMKCESNWYPR